MAWSLFACASAAHLSFGPAEEEENNNASGTPLARRQQLDKRASEQTGPMHLALIGPLRFVQLAGSGAPPPLQGPKAGRVWARWRRLSGATCAARSLAF